MATHMDQPKDLRVPMRPQGYEKLQEELRTLKAMRPVIAQNIASARSKGDLSENAEYHAAKDHQGHIEGRITELEDKLARAEVIDPTRFRGDTQVRFGACVAIEDEEGSQSTYHIVGTDEADIKSHLLSFNTPLGRALMGKTVGDDVEVPTPGGVKNYIILEITYS